MVLEGEVGEKISGAKSISSVEGEVDVNSAMQVGSTESGAQVEASSPPRETLLAYVDESDKKKKEGKTRKTFKRVKRSSGGDKKEEGAKQVDKKRSQEEEMAMEIDEEMHVKVGRFVGDDAATQSNLAGPTDRSCGTQ